MTNATVVIVHGAGAQVEGAGSTRLVAGLRRALAGRHAVLSPAMPDPDEPTHRAWSGAVADVLRAAPGPVLLIGHSLGGSTLLKHLAKSPPAEARTVRGLFLVAAPFWGSPDWEFDEYALPPGAASALPPGVPLFVYHSRDDAVVPVSHATRYGAALPGAVVRILDGRGHEFADGLPELVADLAALGA